jgi:hypothetical protein
VKVAEMVMMVGGAVLVLLLVGVFVWFVTPTVRTMTGPDFEPVPRDRSHVDHAVHSSVHEDGSAGLRR